MNDWISVFALEKGRIIKQNGAAAGDGCSGAKKNKKKSKQKRKQKILNFRHTARSLRIKKIKIYKNFIHFYSINYSLTTSLATAVAASHVCCRPESVCGHYKQRR
jgi:hypothetical protein